MEEKIPSFLEGVSLCRILVERIGSEGEVIRVLSKEANGCIEIKRAQGSITFVQTPKRLYSTSNFVGWGRPRAETYEIKAQKENGLWKPIARKIPEDKIISTILSHERKEMKPKKNCAAA